jgi:hypothetical protein
LPKSLYVSFATQTTSANTTYYWWINSRNTLSTVEDRVQQIIRTPGIFSKGFVRLTQNSVNATSIFQSRKNAADGNISIAVGANATGTFEDTVNTDTVVAGDKYTIRFTPGAATGTVQLQILSLIFEQNLNSTDTVTRTGCAIAIGLATASTTYFVGLAGTMGFQTAEADCKTRIRKDLVAKNLCFRVTQQRNETITVKSRKNGADGNISMPIGSGATGFFEETTNNDILAPGDDYNLTFATGAGTGTFTVQNTQLDYVSKAPKYDSPLIAQVAAGFTLTQNVTYRWALSGVINGNTTESVAQIISRQGWAFSELTVHASANTVNANSVLTFRKNTANGNQNVTIGPLATGYFTDSVNVDTTTTADLVCYQMVVGATTAATLMLRSVSVSATDLTVPITVVGSGGGGQGRSPLYRTRSRRREPEIAIAIVRVRIPLEYIVEKLSVQIKGPLLVPQNQKPVIKYASAVLSVFEHILPLPTRPTPQPPVQKIVRVSIPLTYEVTNLGLQADCSYEVERLFTQDQQHKIVATSINFLLSDLL